MNIYQSIYDLINNYMFGGTIVANSMPDLACTLVSLICAIFVFAIPFIVVYKVICAIVG